jgi:hypothetical protein
MGKCTICYHDAEVSNDAKHPQTRFVFCDICGDYAIDKAEITGKLNLRQRACLYYYLTQNKDEFYRNGTKIYISNDSSIQPPNNYKLVLLSDLEQIFPKNLDEKIMMILINISHILMYVGNSFMVGRTGTEDTYYPIFFIDDSYGRDSYENQFDGIIEILNEYNYLESTPMGDDVLQISLTAQGWKTVYDYFTENTNLPQAFIAMWFDDSMINAREKIKKAVVDCGYIPMLIDEKEHNEFIVPEILFEIKRSRLMIADYTGNRGGVYFETGYAKGLNKPVIMTCKDGDDFLKVHFDTKQISHVVWKNEDDLYERLKKRIEATIGIRKTL